MLEFIYLLGNVKMNLCKKYWPVMCQNETHDIFLLLFFWWIITTSIGKVDVM